jgi:hypothetical protein
MEQTQHTKLVSFLTVLVLIVVAGYVLSSNGYKDSGRANSFDQSLIVTVENTPMVDGVLPVPEGFPQDIPIEESEIIESATTRHPRENLRQLSVAYKSSESIMEKYAEYKEYMLQASFQIEEESETSPVVISGEKLGSKLSVTLNNSEGYTLVQLSYIEN